MSLAIENMFRCELEGKKTTNDYWTKSIEEQKANFANSFSKRYLKTAIKQQENCTIKVTERKQKARKKRHGYELQVALNAHCSLLKSVLLAKLNRKLYWNVIYCFEVENDTIYPYMHVWEKKLYIWNARTVAGGAHTYTEVVKFFK